MSKNGQARIMVVVGRRQNFFLKPFSIQIYKKMYYLYNKKVENQKKKKNPHLLLWASITLLS